MKWKTGAVTGTYIAPITETMYIQLKEPKTMDKAGGEFTMTLAANHCPMFTQKFMSPDTRHAKQRSVIEVHKYFEDNITRYTSLLETLEKADSEQ